MLTVSYYCLSNQLRLLSTNKNNHNLNGEYYLYNALYLSLYLLPPGCPIVNHYVTTYYKNYKQCLDIIPEGQIMNYNIDIIKKEIFNNYNNDFSDYSYFVKAKKINMKLNEEKYIEKIENKENIENIGNISSRSNYNYNKNKNKMKLIKKKGIVLHLNNDNNKRKKIFDNRNERINNKIKKKVINISDNNIFNIKKYSINSSYVSNSRTSINASTELDIKNIKLIYENTDLLPNNNFIERVNKSRIQNLQAPKLKLDLNKINQDFNLTEAHITGNKIKDSFREHANNNMKMKIFLNKNKKKLLEKKIFKINKKMNNSDRKINLNSNNKNNINNNINKNEKKKINLKINNKNILKNEKINNNNNKCEKIFGYKINNKYSINNINNQNKKHVFNNKLNKMTYSFKINNKNKISNLVKYLRIKNIYNKDKECLTERLNIKINNKNQISLTQNISIKNFCNKQ